MIMEAKINPANSDTKTRIFMTAAEMFATQGYDRVSIRQICEKVGVGKPTLYYYFKDKESLLNELIDYTLLISRELMKKHTENITEFSERLFGMVKAHQEFALNYPYFVQLFRMNDFMFLPIKIREQMISYGNGMFLKLLEFLEEGQQNGYLSPDVDLTILAHTMVGTLNQLLHRYLFLNDQAVMSDNNLENLFLFWKLTILRPRD
jgi:AcrR family transcriptional regulator